MEYFTVNTIPTVLITPPSPITQPSPSRVEEDSSRDDRGEKSVQKNQEEDDRVIISTTTDNILGEEGGIGREPAMSLLGDQAAGYPPPGTDYDTCIAWGGEPQPSAT